MPDIAQSLATDLSTRLDGRGVAPAPPTPADLLGGIYVDDWSRGDVTPSAWPSRMGRTLAAVGSPTVAVDGTNFGGHPVLATNATGGHHMRGASLAQLFAAGSHPYVLVVGRWTADGQSYPTLLGLGPSSPAPLAIYKNGGSGSRMVYWAGNQLDMGAADGVGHVFETMLTPAGAVGYAVDGGAIVSGLSGISLSANVNALAVGANTDGSSAGTVFCSRIICASAQPTPEQRAALLAWVAAQDA